MLVHWLSASYHVGEVGLFGDKGVGEEEGVVGCGIVGAVGQQHPVCTQPVRQSGQLAVRIPPT